MTLIVRRLVFKDTNSEAWRNVLVVEQKKGKRTLKKSYKSLEELTKQLPQMTIIPDSKTGKLYLFGREVEDAKKVDDFFQEHIVLIGALGGKMEYINIKKL